MSSSARAAATTTYARAGAAGAAPLLGHLPALARDPARFLARLPGYGDLVDIRLGPSRLVVPTHPELLRQVYADDRTFDKGGPPGGRPAEWADLPQLPYTARVLTEALRLHPPGWVLLRTCTRGTELGGHPLPSGSQVLLSPYVAHHNPRIFADPGRFDPDRWLPERAAALPRWAFAGFANGPRQCLGADYARTEAAIALATVLARWHPSPLPRRRSDDRPVRLTTVLRPHRLLLRALDRTRSSG